MLEKINEFIENKNNKLDLSPATVSIYSRVLKRFARKAEGEDVRNAFKEFMERPVKRSTCKSECGLIKEYLEFCGINVSDLFSSYSIGKREKNQDRINRVKLSLSPDEIKKAMEIPISKPKGKLMFNPDFYIARNDLTRKMLYHTGMRINEIQKMDIDWIKGDYAILPVSANKNKKERPVDLKGCLKELNTYMHKRESIEVDTNALLISNIGKRMCDRSIREVIVNIFKSAGIYLPGRSCHKIRHRRITEMVNSGVPVMLVGAIMGNSANTIESTYFNPTNKELIENIRGRENAA